VKRSFRNSSNRTAAAARPRRAGWRLSSSTLWLTWRWIGWSASLALVGWGLLRLQEYVHAGGAGVQCRLEWVDLPLWLETPNAKDVLREIEAAADLRPSDSIHDPELCARTARNLRRSVWVGDVVRVSKRPDGALRVRATFREPYAYVDVKGRAYLVDETGVRLRPECTTSMVPPEDWLVITGVSNPIPALGQAWGGHDLTAGLALLKCLRDEERQGRLPFRSWLKAIDVANYDRREKPYDGELRIRTINPRCYINWGAPPGEEVKPESSAARKLDMLRSLYGSQGQFPDQPIDVRPEENVWIVKPREAQPAPSRR
jgi:hypothetical protein